MKSIKLIYIFLVLVVNFATAQPGDFIPEEGKERIEAFRVGFFTNQLNLTPKESQEFWPIYNELRDKMDQIRPNFRKKTIAEDMTEAQATDFIEKQFELEQRALDLKKEYFQKLKKVLPVQKIVQLQPLEHEFKRELLKEVRKKRKSIERF